MVADFFISGLRHNREGTWVSLGCKKKALWSPEYPIILWVGSTAPLWSFEGARDLLVGMGGRQGRHDWQAGRQYRVILWEWDSAK